MKNEEQIRSKIKEHEDHIKIILKTEILCDIDIDCIERLLKGRTALLWVLSEDDFITPDEFATKVEYKILCYESTKIF